MSAADLSSGSMNTSRRLEERLVRSQSVAWAAWGLAMLVLALTVAAGAFHLRAHLREHLAQRDGEILTAVALARQYANGSGADLTQRLGNPADQLALALEISQIKDGVLGVRLFDGNGKFETAFPPELSAADVPAADLALLRGLQPVSRFHGRADLSDYFMLGGVPSAERTPLLQVTIPLHAREDSRLVACAQLILDGSTVAREYAGVDEHLWALGIGMYLAGAALMSAVLFWAYLRLRRSYALVEERTERLLRANHELAMAAKTSALGAMTAHLIHGLSNPLANLQDFIESHNNADPDQDLEALVSSTRRMQQLVRDVVRVLGEERTGEQYQIALGELSGVLMSKIGPAAQERGVHVVTGISADGNLSNRDANLILLILENVIQNAIRATPRGGCVRVRFVRQDGEIHCEVEDQGGGIAREMLPRLFTPCRSLHGGSGLGLAISKQLANQLGAELELKENSSKGCLFSLRLPATLLSEEPVTRARASRVPGIAAMVLLLGGLPCLAAVRVPPVWRWSNPTPHGANIVDQAANDSLTVQVGERGQIYLSDDWETWIPRDAFTGVALRGATFFGGRLVITGEAGTILFSDDPWNFHGLTLGTDDWLEGVAASSDLVVAVGDNAAIYISTNAVNWQRVTPSFHNWLRSIACNGSNFVTVGENGLIASSQNGTAWQVRNSGTKTHLNRVAWVEDHYLVVGDEGKAFTSATGIQWEPVVTGVSNSLYAIAGVSDSHLIAGDHEVRLSESGEAAWADQSAPSRPGPAPAWEYFSALWNSDWFLVAGRSGMAIEAARTNLAEPAQWHPLGDSVRSWLWAVARTPSHYVAVGNNGTILSSPDGIDWDLELVPYSVTNSVLLGVGGSSNLLLAVGTRGTILWGTNIYLWNEVSPAPTINDLQGICFDGVQFVVSGGNGTLLTSTSGTNWTKRNVAADAFLMSLAAFPGGLVCVGEDGTVLVSGDHGTNWISQDSGTTNWLSAVRWTGDRLVAVGENGCILTSPDAIQWHTNSSGTRAWLNAIEYIEGTWWIAGNQGTLLASEDTTNWMNLGTLTAKSLYGAACDQGRLVTVGTEGAILRSSLIASPAPIEIASFQRASGINAFLFTGASDQQFQLQSSPDLITWRDGALLEFLDSSGTLIFLEEAGSEAPGELFYRAERVW